MPAQKITKEIRCQRELKAAMQRSRTHIKVIGGGESEFIIENRR